MMDDINAVRGLAEVLMYLDACARWRPCSEELVCLDAFRAVIRLGYQDYFAERWNVPAVFSINRILHDLWLEGMRLAQEGVDMRLCNSHEGCVCDCRKEFRSVCRRYGHLLQKRCELLETQYANPDI